MLRYILHAQCIDFLEKIERIGNNGLLRLIYDSTYLVESDVKDTIGD